MCVWQWQTDINVLSAGVSAVRDGCQRAGLAAAAADVAAVE